MRRGGWVEAVIRGPKMGRPAPSAAIEARDNWPALPFEIWQSLFSFNGNQYLAGQFRSSPNRALVAACGPVHAVLDRRVSVMGEARPIFQRYNQGNPVKTYSDRRLELLKKPWQGGSWRQLVAIAESDIAAAGNSYWIRNGAELVRLNPDWITIVTEEVTLDGVEVAERLLGYVVERPGYGVAGLEPKDVAHYRPGAPLECPFRGESWLAAAASDASTDVELTQYKGNYLKNGAMPSLAVMYEPTLDMAALEAFVPVFADKFTGSMNAGKVMHFLGGRDVKTVGATLDQLAFKAVQGAGETRIAAAAGVPAVVAGFSEGMQGSSLNAGNYVATRRLFADAKIRPLLGALCEAFERLVGTDSDSRLWYDESGVSFFQEDVADEANIRQLKAATIRTLIEAGYKPDSVIDAVTTGDYSILKGSHTGLTSVQLTPPGDGTVPSDQGGTDGPTE